MCIFILALIGILVFYLAGQIQNIYLIEKTDGVTFDLASSWQVFIELWPAMGIMFLSGILFVLLVMKLIPGQSSTK